MKTIRKHLKCLVLLFTILIFCQSCVVYEKNSVSLEWAAKQERKAKVKTNNNQTYKFKRIQSENEHFYGIKETNGDIIKTPLEADKLNKIQLQNKSTSTIATITTIIGSLIGVILVSYFIETGGGNWF